MAFITGNSDQPDTATVTLSVPVKHDGDANDYVLDAIVSCLTLLASPLGWVQQGTSQSPTDAAVYGQMVLDSLTIVWP